MNEGAPYRAACAGYTSCTFGPLFQHYDATRANVPVYHNTTTIDGVSNWSPLNNCKADEDINCTDTTTCNGTVTGPCFTFNGSNLNDTGTIGPWVNPSNLTFPTQTFATSATKDLTSCNLTGWKQVWAKLQWYGIPAFDDYEALHVNSILCGTPSWGTAPGCVSPAGWYYKQDYQLQAKQVRFASLEGYCYWKYTSKTTPPSGPPTIIETDLTYQWNWSIDTNSGIISGDASANQNMPNYPDVTLSWTDMMAFVEDFLSMDASKSVQDIQNAGANWFYTTVTNLIAVGICGCGSGCTATISGDPELVFIYDTSGNCTGKKVNFTLELDQSFSDGSSSSAAFEVNAYINLKSPQNINDVMTACDNLLNYWNLADNAQYPPQSGDWSLNNPLVTRLQATSSGSFPGFLYPSIPAGPGYAEWSATYTDPNTGFYDGHIIGAPLSFDLDLSSGYGYFDPFAYLYCCRCYYGTTSLVKTFGQWSGTTYPLLPSRATHWTTEDDVAIYGLCIGRNRIIGGTTVWTSKWAETKVRLPSIDHARPYGNDVGLIDETCVGCVVSYDSTGGTFTLSNHITVAADSLMAWINGDGMLYKVTAGATSSSLISVTPTGIPWNPNAYPCTSHYPFDSVGVLALLKYPSCPPMGGRTPITLVTDNHDGTCTVVFQPTPVVIASPWAVDLCSSLMARLGSSSGYVPISSSAASVTITATYSDIASAQWLCLHGALDGETVSGVAKWYEQDTQGKGNYATLEWVTDVRNAATINGDPNPYALCNVVLTDCSGSPLTPPACNNGYVGFAATDQCAGWVTCEPWMIILSPNGETPKHGQVFDFGLSFTPDPFYGNRQCLAVSQVMTDPLFPSPHQPRCDGGPISDGVVPRVESRVTMPGSSTTPPNNGFGWGQNQTASVYPVNYTAVSPVTTDEGLFVYPIPYGGCFGQTQPTSHYVPTGIFTLC